MKDMGRLWPTGVFVSVVLITLATCISVIIIYSLIATSNVSDTVFVGTSQSVTDEVVLTRDDNGITQENDQTRFLARSFTELDILGFAVEIQENHSILFADFSAVVQVYRHDSSSEAVLYQYGPTTSLDLIRNSVDSRTETWRLNVSLNNNTLTFRASGAPSVPNGRISWWVRVRGVRASLPG